MFSLLKSKVASPILSFHLRQVIHYPGNTHVVGGSITVQSTSCQTGFKLAVVDVNKYFSYKQAKVAYWEVGGT